MARYTGPVSPPVPPRGHEALPQGQPSATPRSAPSSAAPTPPGQHQRAPPQGVASSACSCARSRRCGASTSVLERQFKRYFETAERRPGVTGENLLRLLETRLDNVVFRMGFATSRAAGAPAREPRPLHGQRPRHHHPVVPGAATATRIEVRETSRKSEYFKNVKRDPARRPASGLAERRRRQARRQRHRAAPPRPDAARAQRAARRRVLLEVIAQTHDRTGKPADRARRGARDRTASTRPARCRPATA